MEDQWITSVGIDLGTSTTKWIVSRLKLSKTSGGFSLPRYDITERKLVYMSPIFTTPLESAVHIDVPALTELLANEYKLAGILPDAIQSGAVIITGETATKRNAEKLVHTLARNAGQFVVATAGADLESLLAGKGSGAEARSLETRGIVVNVDIGGGTANAAYFLDGEMIATVTLHIGGRLIQISDEGRITYVAEPITCWAERTGIVPRLELGDTCDYYVLSQICRSMADTLVSYIVGEGCDGEAVAPLLVAKPSCPLPVPDEIWISGGIGGMMNGPPPGTIEETAIYGDIGPLLASSLLELSLKFPVPIRPAKQAERATVIGAGTQTTDVSGATLYYDEESLPLRNVPVAVCRLPDEEDSEETDSHRIVSVIQATMNVSAAVYGDIAATDPPFALAIKGGGYCSYRRLQRLADAIAACYQEAAPLAEKMLVVCEGDMGKSLGYALARRRGRVKSIVCVDQLRPSPGDYIDIGVPIKDDIVPVVMKTLVFNKNQE